MRYENVEKANKYKSEIETLQAEIIEIQAYVSGEIYSQNWLFSRIIKRKPFEKTYKGFYSSKDVDSINSMVLINPREAQVVVDVKKAEIEEFKKMILDLE